MSAPQTDGHDPTVEDAPGMVDIHSHLVPGVDDGARHLQDVLESAERMQAEGIGTILTTPHIRASLASDPARLAVRLDSVTDAFEMAKRAIAESYPVIRYHRGHEVLIDLPEPDLSDPRMRLAGTTFVLVEWPRLAIPPGTARVLRWIRDQGYRPVVAHPERYTNILHQPGVIPSWRDAGAFLQVNYGSFVGRYGSEAREMAYRLMEAGQVDYLASDFHGKSSLRIYCEDARDALDGRAPAGMLDTLTRVNPSRLLDGMDPLPAGALRSERNVFQKLRRMVVRHDRSERKKAT